MFRRLSVPAVVAVIAAVAVGLAGCGGSSSAASVPDRRHESDIVLPLDHYLPSSHERAVLATAASELTASCMQRLGFAGYPVESFQAQDQTPRHGNTYGVLDDAVAQSTAYSPTFAPLLEHSSEVLSQSLQAFSGPDAEAAINGTNTAGPAGVGGATAPAGTPSGGCSAEGARKVYALVGAPEPAGVPWYATLEGRAYDRALNDPRLQPTIHKWSACMKDQGFSYADPDRANNDQRWADEANHDQAVKVAVADVHCKWSSRYLDTFVALTAVYQTQIVEQNAERLQSLVDVRTKLLAAVASAGLGRVRPLSTATTRARLRRSRRCAPHIPWPSRGWPLMRSGDL